MNNKTKLCCLVLSMVVMAGSVWAQEDPVVFPDPCLANAINIETPFTDPCAAQMETLVFLDLRNHGISDLTGLDTAVNLETLWLDNNLITDVSALGALTKLEMLWLENNQISDISTMVDIDLPGDPCQLMRLRLSGNLLTDPCDLAAFTGLEILHLGENQISDLSVLAGLTNLTQLRIDNNQITDPCDLAALTNLTWLRADNNQISDLSGLAGLTALTNLWLHDNQITDPCDLAGLTNLMELGLDGNQITDPCSLSGLTALTWLRLDDNQITDPCGLENLTNLTDLFLHDNQITSIAPLTGMVGLDTLTLENNPLDNAAYETDLDAIMAGNPTAELSYGFTLTLEVVEGEGTIDVDPVAELYAPPLGDADPCFPDVILTGMPAVGFETGAWLDELDAVISNDPCLVVTMDGPKTVKVEFDNAIQTVEITKLKIKAGKDRTLPVDSFGITGQFDPCSLALINDPCNPMDNIAFALTFDDGVDLWGHAENPLDNMDDVVVKQNGKGINTAIKYKASTKLEGKVSALSLDLVKGKLVVKGKKLDLSGLRAPVMLELLIGNILAQVEVDEDIINGAKISKSNFIPIALMVGVENELRVDNNRAIFKAEKGFLKVKGELASANPVDLTAEDVVITWGGYTTTITAASGFIIQKGDDYYLFKLPKGEDSAIAVAKFNFAKRTYMVIVKDPEDADLISQVGLDTNDFGLSWTDFDETVTVTDIRD